MLPDLDSDTEGIWARAPIEGKSRLGPTNRCLQPAAAETLAEIIATPRRKPKSTDRSP